MSQSPMLALFGEELKLARTAAGLTQAQLAEAVSYSTALVTKVENGERRPSADFAQRCDAVLGTGGLLARVQSRISKETVADWFREWAAVEEEAIALRWFEPLFVPGLLQTEQYARTVLTASGLLPPNDIDQQVVARMGRQEILNRTKSPLLTAVVDEHVLRRPVGGPEVMHEQLQHLVKVGTALPRVRIHVVPVSVGAHAGLEGPLVIATGQTGADLVYHEDRSHGRVFDQPSDVAAEIQVWESIRGEALPHQQSIEFIREVAETWN